MTGHYFHLSVRRSPAEALLAGRFRQGQVCHQAARLLVHQTSQPQFALAPAPRAPARSRPSPGKWRMAYSSHHCGREKVVEMQRQNAQRSLRREEGQISKSSRGSLSTRPYTNSRRASAIHQVQTWAHLCSCGNTTTSTQTRQHHR
jgi:hypothetical protein